MHTTLRRALTTVAAAAIALGTVALQPAEARKRHHHEAGAVILGTLAALAFIAAANQHGYPYEGYSEGYQGYPYGPGYPYYWNGHRYVPGYGPYGPDYGEPVPPGNYRR